MKKAEGFHFWTPSFFLQILPYLFRIFLYSFFPFSFNLVIIRLFQKSIKNDCYKEVSLWEC